MPKYEINIDLSNPDGLFEDIYNKLEAHELITGGADNNSNMAIAFTTPLCPDAVKIARTGLYSGTFDVFRGEFIEQLQQDGSTGIVFQSKELMVTRGAENGVPSRVNLYVGQQNEYFCIYWDRSEGATLITYFGKILTDESEILCMFSYPTVRGIRLFDADKTKCNAVLEQRQILRNDQICTTPIIVTSPNNLYIGTLAGIDNACTPTSVAGLVELDGYDLIRLNPFDTENAAGHEKNTTIRLVY